jgi:predicted RNase H-like nuclease (RuvC/YqgF family)
VYHYRSSRKEVSELKAQLNKNLADKELVRSLKEELEEKSRKCDQLESENESLERSLKKKVWMYN